MVIIINDRDRHEISNIGIQIADFDGDLLGAPIALHLNAVPEPATLCLLGAALLLGQARRRSRARPR